MHLEFDIECCEENIFLKQKVSEFVESVKSNNEKKFLEENPDFIQMIMNLSESEKMKIVD
jgi:hypothetical protein